MESTTQQEPVIQEQGTPGGAARLIRHVNRFTKKRFSAEDKIRIVLEGFRKELPISDLCRREQISSAIFYKGRSRTITPAICWPGTSNRMKLPSASAT